ncbi:polysaccharide pyruvyl transferase family protein [Methanobacterium sp. MZD130B]|uniref:polysaccharide pyruvyl transferase family protein n=1 Tax=Methanobacterium sp. MZD130B TaxID=3394378 RepID=UPI0039FD07C6
MAGNGPYENKGCEAIVKGTVKIVREYFKDPKFVCISHFQSNQQYIEQVKQETDNRITHLESSRLNRNKLIQNFWKPNVLLDLFHYLAKSDNFYQRSYREMLPYLDEAVAVLSLGGDNYSLDYGLPHLFTALDELVIEQKKPIILWGASVGPFDKIPDYEIYMKKHLQHVTGIFARESATVDYLYDIGVRSNVYPVSDPAFFLDPIKPEFVDFELPNKKEEAIGINLSPLMAHYINKGDIERWKHLSASIIKNVLQQSELPIFLIPHVMVEGSNDYIFLKNVLKWIEPKYKKNITLIPPLYNAEELKWIISKMTLFAGSRTHSTIASISSGVPTLSFAYSIKAKGINQDMFREQAFLIEPNSLTPNHVSESIQNMLTIKDEIKSNLVKNISSAKNKALKAGEYLKAIL